MKKKKEKTTFQKITYVVVWVMLILTVSSVVLMTLSQTGILG